MENKFYITTTLPYVNADPHIGFALEIVEADVLARFQNLKGKEVFFNTGTDEHGLKVYQKAQELGMDPVEYASEKAKNFFGLKELLNLSFNNFIRTTDKHHVMACQEFWKICEGNGDIYKKKYKIKYCVGCEMEKTDSELIDCRCPLHPDKDLEIIEEENYFFRYSKYEKKLLELYEKNPDFVKPSRRFNEIKAFVAGGLQDFSISRLKSKLPWGVPVPGDSQQVMYVWFDALINYISAIGWPDDMEKFNSWWPGMQLAGKDNLRPQSAMWQVMLMSANIDPSKQIFIDGFINADGQKMSKSLGNVIEPKQMVEKFGIDGTRYLILTGGAFGEDIDVSWEKFTTKFNSDLANGIGNLTSRVVTLYQKIERNFEFEKDLQKFYKKITLKTENNFKELRLDLELSDILEEVKKLDKYIEENKPWELAKLDNKESFEKVMEHLVTNLAIIALRLSPFIPETSQKIITALENKKTEALFQRIKS